jgi:predicted acetyltransferase
MIMENSPELVESSPSLITLRDELIGKSDELGEDEDHLVDAKLLRRDSAAYLKMLVDHSHGMGLLDGWVPQNTYWYVRTDGTRLIGASTLRHRLTPLLEDVGGHIGYVVRPSERRKGHGVALLSLTLRKARDLGLSRVLLTTDARNGISRKIIEQNGGMLAGEAVATSTGVMKARYWISLR